MATKHDLDALRVATKRHVEALRVDVEALRDHLDQRFEILDQRFEVVEHRVIATMRGENVQQTRTLLLAAVPMMIALVSLTFTAVRLG